MGLRPITLIFLRFAALKASTNPQISNYTRHLETLMQNAGMTRQRRKKISKSIALEEVRNGPYAFILDSVLIKAVVPVVCGIRPGYLIDNVSFDDIDHELLIESLQQVKLNLAIRCLMSRTTLKYLRSFLTSKYSSFIDL